MPTTPQSMNLQELAKLLALEIVGGDGDDITLTGIAPLATATASELSFLDNPKYDSQLAECSAGAIIIHADKADKLPAGKVGLLSINPYMSYAKALALFYPQYLESEFCHNQGEATIAESAQLGVDCQIEPGAVISAEVKLGDKVHIGANSFIGEGVTIGANSKIAANVSIVRAEIGQGVIIHSGARIGQDGFGFAGDATGIVKVPQVGGVIIEDEVEIGANTTIDCGSIDNTVIGKQTKIDNLVQIGHNVKIGSHCQIVAGVGIAGSTSLGNQVVIGGQVGIVGHISIADQTTIAARSLVTKSIEESGQIMAGVPAMPMAQWKRQQAMIKKMSKE